MNVALDPAVSLHADAPREPLERYVRFLWAPAAGLTFADRPSFNGPSFIVGRDIHLPSWRPASGDAAWHWYRAAAAHAGAHLAYSPPVFEGQRPVPVTRALLCLLEDARVETLACRELPGLRRLWTPLHTATPADGDSFAVLMLRLARALADPRYDDPHPWVRKGCALFFVDRALQIMAPSGPDQLRRTASALGHDIGQMRLAFDAKSHEVGPDYRDDGRWMWPGGQTTQPQASIEPDGKAGRASAGRLDETAPPTPSETDAYPEWDRLIRRLRHDWCDVVEYDVASVPVSPSPPWPRRRRSRSTLTDRTTVGDAGDRLVLDALVRLAVARRLRQPADGRVFRVTGRGEARRTTALLIDRSASSADPWGTAGSSRLEASCRIAAWLGAGRSSGSRTAIWGFSSNGRRAVAMHRVKGFADLPEAVLAARLQALGSADSTRLGAALRHATARLDGERASGHRSIVVVSDGRPYDIDAFDPHYLVEDARQAVLAATRRRIRVCCIVVDPDGLATAARIFGSREVGLLTALDDLPRLAGRLRI